MNATNLMAVSSSGSDNAGIAVNSNANRVTRNEQSKSGSRNTSGKNTFDEAMNKSLASNENQVSDAKAENSKEQVASKAKDNATDTKSDIAVQDSTAKSVNTQTVSDEPANEATSGSTSVNAVSVNLFGVANSINGQENIDEAISEFSDILERYGISMDKLSNEAEHIDLQSLLPKSIAEVIAGKELLAKLAGEPVTGKNTDTSALVGTTVNMDLNSGLFEKTVNIVTELTGELTGKLMNAPVAEPNITKANKEGIPLTAGVIDNVDTKQLLTVQSSRLLGNNALVNPGVTNDTASTVASNAEALIGKATDLDTVKESVVPVAVVVTDTTAKVPIAELNTNATSTLPLADVNNLAQDIAKTPNAGSQAITAGTVIVPKTAVAVVGSDRDISDNANGTIGLEVLSQRTLRRELMLERDNNFSQQNNSNANTGTAFGEEIVGISTNADDTANLINQPANTAFAERLMQGMSSPVDNVVSVEVPLAESPVTDYDIRQQIVEQARMLRTQNDTQLIIRLRPEHLGELTLKVSVGADGAVNASFHTDNIHVRNTIENSLVQLRQELNNQGIKVDKVEIFAGLSDGQLPQGEGQQAWQQFANNNRPTRLVDGDVEDYIDGVEIASINEASAGLNTATTAEGIDYRI